MRRSYGRRFFGGRPWNWITNVRGQGAGVPDRDRIQPGLGISIGEVGYALGTMPGCNFWGYVNPANDLFKAIPSDNPIGWTYLQVLAAPPGQEAMAGGPRRPKMISGLDGSARDDVLIGCYSEWIRSRSVDGTDQQGVVPKEVGGLVVQFVFKAGRLVVCTLDLLQAAGADPVATIALHDLIGYCFTRFEPKTVLPSA